MEGEEEREDPKADDNAVFCRAEKAVFLLCILFGNVFKMVM